MRRKIVLMGVAVLVGCASVGPTLGPLTDIKVDGVELRGSNTSACDGFTFEVGEAQRFFDRAVVVTPYDINYGYLVAGCYAHGTAMVRGEPVTWEVDRGGTGTVTFSKEFTFAVADPRRHTKPE